MRRHLPGHEGACGRRLWYIMGSGVFSTEFGAIHTAAFRPTQGIDEHHYRKLQIYCGTTAVSAHQQPSRAGDKSQPPGGDAAARHGHPSVDCE